MFFATYMRDYNENVQPSHDDISNYIWLLHGLQKYDICFSHTGTEVAEFVLKGVKLRWFLTDFLAVFRQQYYEHGTLGTLPQSTWSE